MNCSTGQKHSVSVFPSQSVVYMKVLRHLGRTSGHGAGTTGVVVSTDFSIGLLVVVSAGEIEVDGLSTGSMVEMVDVVVWTNVDTVEVVTTLVMDPMM